MRRAILIATAAIILWMGLKDWTYRTYMSFQTSEAPQALDYSQTAAWARKPEESQPGGWEKPWGVDVFLLPPEPRAPYPAGIVPADHESSSVRTDAFVISAAPLFGETSLYAPYLRYPSPALNAQSKTNMAHTTSGDALAAFRQYLERHNRERGVLLAAPHSALASVRAIIAEIEDNEELLLRFGGLILLDELTASSPQISCSEAFQGTCALHVAMSSKVSMWQRVLPNLNAPPLTHIFEDMPGDTAKVSDRLAVFSSWLDENAPKPAEPLGGFDEMEAVDIAPIRRPGEVDESSP